MKVSEDVRQRLDALALVTPEWRGWLTLLQEALNEVNAPAWDSVEPSLDQNREPTAPALAGARIALEPSLGREWARRLLQVAGRAGGAGAASLRAAAQRLDGLRFLEAAVCDDLDAVAGLAADSGTDGKALGALVGLAAMPLLQACRRRVVRGVAEGWSRGYCAVCGAWPTLAEVRGLERTIRLRCGRCGGDWRIEWLTCPYCSVADHERLGSLVSDSHGETRTVRTCAECRGYFKTVTTLGPWPPDQVSVEDLATVDLDVAALERGYGRPGRPGYALGASLVEASSGPTADHRRTWGAFGWWR